MDGGATSSRVGRGVCGDHVARQVGEVSREVVLESRSLCKSRATS